MVFTASHVFLDTLLQAGITHIFCNLGSDHPALVEAFAERVMAFEKQGVAIVTCPNEMVALSCAQGYAQVRRKPAAVIVHVDCGTQALAGAVHNVSVCRVPVFIYAGASPFSQEEEFPGSRNEFIHWLQNTTDQPGIVRQYMRHIGEIKSGKTVAQTVLRSLQFTMSDPQGPAYVWASREFTEEHLEPAEVPKLDIPREWGAIEPAPLSLSAVGKIAEGLMSAKSPLIVTSYSGRNPACVPLLTSLAERLACPVFSACPTTVNVPHDHWCHAGVAYGGKNELVEKADVILVLDSDIPWLPKFTKPRKDATIFHVDCDPLKSNMNVFYIPAQVRARADSATAVEQLLDAVDSPKRAALLNAGEIETRRAQLKQRAEAKTKELVSRESGLNGSKAVTVPEVLACLRSLSPKNSLVLNEAISNYPLVWDHTRPSAPGSLMTSGASSLGWGLGAAIGAIMAGHADQSCARDLVTLVVGDGSFIFGVPSAAFWISRRYKAPFLTIVLNNGGWKSPKLSMLGVHPEGVGSKASAGDLNVSFGPDSPDYGGIAKAAGGAWAGKITQREEITQVLTEAVKSVTQDRRSAVVEVCIEKF